MDKTIFPCVIGLGYVGLPVFTRLKRVYKTVGYDINAERVSLLQKKIDLNNEIKKKDLKLENKSVIALSILLTSFNPNLCICSILGLLKLV